MVNEIPVNMFMFMLGTQFVALLYSIWLKNKEPDSERIDIMLTAGLSAGLGWLNANMILNGNVVMVQSTGTAYSYIPIQSLPLHYFLLSIAIITAILVIWFVVDYLRIRADKDELFTSLGGDL